MFLLAAAAESDSCAASAAPKYPGRATNNSQTSVDLSDGRGRKCWHVSIRH